MSTLKDAANDMKVVASITPANRDNASVNGASADTSGFRRALVIVHVGATDIASTVELEDSDDDSSFADVDVISVASTEVTIGATDDGEVFVWDVDVDKIRRYLRVQHTAGDGTVGTLLGASIVLYNPRKSPVTQQNTVNRV